MPSAQPLPPTRPRLLRADRIQNFRPSVFTETRELAERYGAIDLGQGAPGLSAPRVLLDDAMAAIAEGHNQYPPAAGLAELRRAIANSRLRRFGIHYDADREVVVTAGATEAVTAALLALCNPGDEVLTLDPCYDAYEAAASLAGARLVAVPLATEGDRFCLDEAALRAAVTPRTRLLLLNSPHNPTGKVFTAAELAAMARVCLDHELTAVTDEVYEHLVYDGAGHHSLASVPGMRERTLVVSSAGKTFNVTGWKVGWACGPGRLVEAVLSVKQFLTFASGTPFQLAVARMLGDEEAWTAALRGTLQRHRDLLRTGLEQAGLRTYRGEGGYFLQADVRGAGYLDGTRFCRDLPARAGVTAIPCSAFRHNPQNPHTDHLVRFSFCKPADVVREATSRLTGKWQA
ncbi:MULTISPECIES: aminotransferase class I/II-fold pyridoxal phosphate-dependent enzyme [unclassified Streptomyces]|uniref:aminotransferase class I/II-fold pyridoxal phosphate-dependent enzyme n=1 Tax=unclassified Streptomyces TaxID=2593676 RepID=UPI0027E584BB|nr:MULTISPECIES: aminotransferase class I/II-fold pyridoxal phosphate-dependent enzyme [unclassified Streptomyces]